MRAGKWTRWLVVLLVGVAGAVPAAFGRAKASPGEPGASIAVFDLKAPIIERPISDVFLFSTRKPVALKDLVARLKEARDDKEVKAVVLTLDEASLGIGLGQIEELRQAIGQIRAADKDVYVHSDILTTGTYALVSGATHVGITPVGILLLSGIHAESPYVRGLLNKIAVTPDFMTCGEYKSAAEILMREGPSPEAEEMMNWLLDSFYENLVTMIAEGRNVPADKARQWIDAGLYTAEQAQKAGLIDAVQQRKDLEGLLKTRYGDNARFVKDYGAKKGPQVDFSSPFAVFNIFKEILGTKKRALKDAVGIVYVTGMIMTGSEEPNPFGGMDQARSTTIRKALDEAASEDSIKAVVLRIDSGGGSATASEIILDATRRLKEKKPFVVSMGDVAGSGGYYVACASDVIFADKTTITGSIGVVSGKLVTTDMWGKIGITWKEYKRGENAAIFSSSEVFTDSERARLRGLMDEVYDVFKGHVKASRGERLTKELDQIAGGRVYTGAQALDLGLVDRIGTLDDAVRYVAAEAKLSDYEIRVVPEPKNFFEMIVEEMGGGKEEDDKNLTLVRMAGTIGSVGGADALPRLLLPLLRSLDPARFEAVWSALTAVDLLHREGVTLTMPPIVIQP